MKTLKNKKLIISYITLGLVFILMGNSNNNPSTYMERIFKPIYFKNGIFYYSTIISIMLVYYSLKNINNEKKIKYINSFLSRLIVAIIFMAVSAWLNTYTTKIYKSFSNNLNAIYMNRDETSMEFDCEKNKITVKGKISIINSRV